MYNDVAQNIQDFDLVYPETIIPEPKDSDYKIGFIRRYFVKKANDNDAHIFEVDDSTFSKYSKKPFWIGDSIKWRIAGPLNEKYKPNGEVEDRGVQNSNKAAIARATTTLKNIKLYLPNLLQFYRP